MCGKIRVFFILLLTVFFLSITACLQEPTSIQQDISPPDSAWKIIENLQFAYVTKNPDLFTNCLHEEFQFLLLPQDWDDYNGDGIIDSLWGRDIEIQFTENMFNNPQAEIIELYFEGNSETVWYGDSTGVTLQLPRSFDLNIYYWTGEEQSGYRAAGEAVFLCKPDGTGEYKIWRWLDQSEV